MSSPSRLAALALLLPSVAFAQADRIAPTFRLEPAPAFATGEIRPDTVYLAAGTLRSVRPATVDELRAQAADATLDTRHILQFAGPLTGDQKAALAQAGVVLRDYLPANAYIAELAATDPDAFAGLGFVRAATPILPEWKLSPELGRNNFTTTDRIHMASIGRAALIVTAFPGEDPIGIAQQILAASPNAQLFYAEPVGDGSEISVAVDAADAARLAEIPGVQFVEPAPELTLRNATTRWIAQSNQTNVTPVYDAGIRGEGQIVAVVDGKIDQNHCAFAGGKILFYNSTAGADSHGTHVAGTVAGNSTALADLRGIAYEANLVFDDIPSFTDTAMYAVLQQHHNQGARIHTNSWGDDGTTSYNSLARGVDRFTYDFEDSLVCFAATNTSLLKNPENAKNLLSVGASQDTPNQGNFCSGGAGPTVDGRRKPEVFLPGCNTLSARSSTACSTIGLTGTSMASPAVAGSAALVRQYFTDGYYPTGAEVPSDAFTPSGALVKAALINSTVDMTGIAGFPSNGEGWGRILLNNTLFFTGENDRLIVRDIRNASGLSTGQNNALAFNVSSAAAGLRITMVFVDPPASATTGSGAAWINDLDLEVVAPNGDVFKGNVLTGGVSVTGGTADNKNNVEQMVLTSPQTGAWLARVKGTAVNQGTQGFALVISGDVNEGPAPLQIALEGSAPTSVLPLTALPVQATVSLGDDTLVPGSVTLHWSANGIAFTPVAMTLVSGTTYEGTIPGFTSCDDTPAFYISAAGDATGTVTTPAAGAAGPYTLSVGVNLVAIDDDFETNTGWTVNALGLDTAVSGQWQRMAPQETNSGGLIAQPGSTPSGTQCWVTNGTAGSSAGVNDVDSGSTSLYSPVFDLSSVDEAVLTYTRWYSNHAGAEPNSDIFVVDITNDGTNWVNVETVGPTGAQTQGGWNTVSFDVQSIVALTSTMRLRFIAADADPGSLVEAAVDDVQVSSQSCEVPVPACAGDVNGDGFTNAADFTVMAGNFGTGSGAVRADGDLNNDGAVNASDFTIMAGDFGCVQ